MDLEAVKVKASQEQIFCEFQDGEMVILNLQDGVYYGLDPVGARIWGLIQTGQTVADILQALLAEYAVDRERCEADLKTLLLDLQAHGLVEFVDEDAG